VGDSIRYEASAEEGSIADIFGGFDGELQSVVVGNGISTLTRAFPETVDPEPVSRVVRETHPDTELASQRRIVTPSHLRSMIEDLLTRQTVNNHRWKAQSAVLQGVSEDTTDHGTDYSDKIFIYYKNIHYANLVWITTETTLRWDVVHTLLVPTKRRAWP
jgi:hypothetical protein